MQISPFFRLTSSPCDIDYTGKRNSQIRVHMRTLWLFKVCQKIAVMLSKQNFSKSGKCAENVFDQFSEPHNLSYTYPNQLILEPKLKRKMRRRHRKKNQPIGYRMQSVQRVEVGSKLIFDILSIIWILGNFYPNEMFWHISVYIDIQTC